MQKAWNDSCRPERRAAGWMRWGAVVFAMLGGCATQKAPPPPPAEPAPVVVQSAPVAEPEPVRQPVQEAPPKPAKPVKPVKPAKVKAGKKDSPPPAGESAPAGSDLMLQEVPSAAPASSVPQVVPGAETAKKEVPIKGPAWLKRCATKRLEGGVILCDANYLLVSPGPGVKVFVNDPSLVRTLPGGAKIPYRAGLPRPYRFFVVP